MVSIDIEHLTEDEVQEAMEEASYFFALQDITNYVNRFGFQKVLEDILKMYHGEDNVQS